MTSADENLMPFISPQIMSIIDNLPNDISINYFLLYNTKNKRDEKLKNIEILRNFSKNFKNLTFQDIEIENEDFFSRIALYGGKWTSAAYYPIMAHKMLPKHIDRVLYLDAGDVFIAGDFREFYFTDFCNNLAIVTPGRFKKTDSVPVTFEEEDLYDLSLTDQITRGVFNSGSYVLNLDLMRQIDFCENEYITFARGLKRIKRDIKEEFHEYAYFGDQGFLSALFLGKMKYYKYPEEINIWYMPFNFCLWYFDQVEFFPWYTPVIIHFAGAPKPWTIKYPYDTDLLSSFTASHNISDLKKGQMEYYLLWHEYVIKSDMIIKNLN